MSPEEQKERGGEQMRWVSLAEALRPVVHRACAGRKDCCLAMGRALCELLDLLQIPAQPLAVTLTVFNRALTDHILRHDPELIGGEIRGPYPDDAHYVRCGKRAESKKGWSGHLIVLARQEMLLDLTLDQTQRPAKGVCPSNFLLATVQGNWITERAQASVTDNGCLVTYEAHPEDQDFRRTDDWSNEALALFCVERALQVLDRKIAKEAHQGRETPRRRRRRSSPRKDGEG